MAVRERAREVLVRASFGEEPDGTPRDKRSRDEVAAIRTYGYLRLAMVGVTVAIVASVLYDRVAVADCFQGSISAYFHTPSHSIFVGGLVAIGVALIAIKGSTIVEDLLLDAAGLLAPIVAFVPTTFQDRCVPDQPLPEGDKALTALLEDGVQNNVWAYLLAVTFAFAVTAVLFLREWRRSEQPTIEWLMARIVMFAVWAVVLEIGWWLLASDRILRLHAQAAIAMFVFLALASLSNSAWLILTNRRAEQPTDHWRAYACIYGLIGALMLVIGIVFVVVISDDWDHKVLVLEMTEIGLFGAMWVVQSIERRGRILQPPPSDEVGV